MQASERLNLTSLVRVLRRRFPVILACAVLLPAVAVFFSIREQKEYTASASLLFRDPGFAQTLFGSSVLSQGTDPALDAATNIKLVTQGVVADATARALGGDLTGSQIAGAISASSEGQSNVVSVSARDHSPQRAATIANTYAEQYIALRQDADRAKIAQGVSLLQKDYKNLSPAARVGPVGRGLQQQLNKLQTLASVQTGNAELTQPADVPSSPSSPRPVRNGIFGGLLGLVLGIGAALLFERLDRRVREPEQLREAFGRPLLGTIPQSRSIAKAASDSGYLSPIVAEAFRMLRANLQYFDVDSKVRSVVVTSPSSGDGKTTVAWNLAAVAAGPGARVLLIEADLRHPMLARRLPAPPERGLSEFLAGHADFEEVVVDVLVQEGVNGDRDGRWMDMIPAGRVPPNPVDLIESARMEELIAQGQREYDFVVIDTPPTTVVSDAIPLINQVSGVIVVSRIGVTTRHAVSRLRDQLTNLSAHTLGVVVNGGRAGDPYYGYYGSAGYYGAKPNGSNKKREAQPTP
jgi:capsular exopolysaccharide synthesis family protein